MTDTVTKAELIEANTALTNEIKSLKEELESVLTRDLAPPMLEDSMTDRIGELYPESEREARLMGREEQVMLSAVTIAIVKLIANSEGKDASPDFVLEFVKKAREPYLTGNLNPQVEGGNPRF